MAALALDLTPCPAAAPGRATLVLLEPTRTDDGLVDVDTPANDGQYPARPTYHYDPPSRKIRYEEYHPYGTSAYRAVDSSVEVSAKRYRYTGMERDEETGLGYHSARYYAPWLGRWTAADPIGLGDGVNRYAYGPNNPTGGADPEGTGWLSELQAEMTKRERTDVSPVYQFTIIPDIPPNPNEIAFADDEVEVTKPKIDMAPRGEEASMVDDTLWSRDPSPPYGVEALTDFHVYTDEERNTHVQLLTEDEQELKVRTYMEAERRADSRGDFDFGIPANRTTAVDGGFTMEATAAAEGRRMLADARAELITDASQDSKVKVAKISVGNAFRDADEQFDKWDSGFYAYLYQHMKKEGIADVKKVDPVKLAKYVEHWIGVPGYSNHQGGVAIDLLVYHVDPETGKAKKVEKSNWEKSPVHEWLVNNAHEYGFTPLADEPWHWVYSPEKAP